MSTGLGFTSGIGLLIDTENLSFPVLEWTHWEMEHAGSVGDHGVIMWDQRVGLCFPSCSLIKLVVRVSCVLCAGENFRRHSAENSDEGACENLAIWSVKKGIWAVISRQIALNSDAVFSNVFQLFLLYRLRNVANVTCQKAVKLFGFQYKFYNASSDCILNPIPGEFLPCPSYNPQYIASQVVQQTQVAPLVSF